jgi:subtilisin family serine protease/quinol monooxygenase YgiN
MKETPSNAGLFAVMSELEAIQAGNVRLLDVDSSAPAPGVGFVAATDGIAVEVADSLGDTTIAQLTKEITENLPADWALRDDSIRDAEGDGWTYRGVTALPPAGRTPPVADAWEMARGLAQIENVLSATPLFAQVAPLDSGDNTSTMRTLMAAGGASQDGPCNHWHLDMLRVDKATDYLRDHNLKPGDGVTVAVVDTGYTRNPEIFERLTRRENDPDIVRGDDLIDGEDPLDPLRGRFPFTTPSHGTAVTSVIVSPEGKPTGWQHEGFVNGIAPAALVTPIRVTTHVAILLPNKLIEGIRAAVAQGADVINTSLGTPYGWAALRSVVQYAADNGVILVAASGNYWPRVVYPAAFSDTLAAACCDESRQPWRYAGAGATVDIMAPGVDVCRASSQREGSTDNIFFIVGPSTGTTYAAACCSGLAALWLSAHGGRHKIAEHYGGELAYVPKAFRYLLRSTAAKHTEARFASRYGAGIPQADELLKAQLPSREVIDDGQAERLAAQDAESLFRMDGAGRPTAVLGNSPEGIAIEALLGDMPDGALKADLARELQFHFDSRPDLWTMTETGGYTDEVTMLRSQLIADQHISPTLRGQLEKAQTVPEAPEPPAAVAQRIRPEQPPYRRLRVYAFDPRSGTSIESVGLNEATVAVRWEDAGIGPTGEYLEVIDIDPPSRAAYDPVDLNDPYLLASDGLEPSEGVPQFHQQMVYAVAMKTIEHFERALGRPVIWSSSPESVNGAWRNEQFIPRLRIYPHGMRMRNAYYSPNKHSLLFGYFQAPAQKGRARGETVFTCLSYDIVAHEMSHSLMHGMYRYFIDDTNPDVFAFHEAFSDMVALFQHFTHPEILRSIIEKTRGDLELESPLGQLATQFGQATGNRGALRSAIGDYDQDGNWQRRSANPNLLDLPEYVDSAHLRGSILVAAVFDAFLKIYQQRARSYIRLATGGSGILRPGEISPYLATALADEAAKTASQVLNICVRALDYVPPIDITFGEYLRAIVTADRDMVPDDHLHYRVIFSESFHAWGIYPVDVRTVSPESLCWDPPEPGSPCAQFLLPSSLRMDLYWLLLDWEANQDRKKLHDGTRKAKASFNYYLKHNADAAFGDSIGIDFSRSFEVHTLRPASHTGDDGRIRTSIVVTLTQKRWHEDKEFRTGSTILFDLASGKIRYVIYRRSTSSARAEKIAVHKEHRLQIAAARDPYLAELAGESDNDKVTEPFAALHLFGSP